MRQFMKYTLASILGFTICMTFLVILGLIALTFTIIASNDTSLTLKDKTVLTVDLSGFIVERADENPFYTLMGKTESQQGLDDIVGAIDKAANAKEISAIYINAGIMTADYASLQEIRQALLRAKAKKKLIVSYAKEYTQGAYYVCSVADKVWIHPEGMLDLHGLSAQPMFIKDLLDKFGVKMKVVKVGKFKSATERYTEEKMSDENRLQVTRYINGIWNTIASEIGKARNITVADVNKCADGPTTLKPTDYLLREHLVDKTLYAEDVKTELKAMLKISKDEELEKISCSSLNRSSFGTKEDKNKIAVYYCEGSIVRMKEAGSVMGEAGIVSPEMVKDLEELAKDDDIKAVVIRINSGGGDAFASEEIWHAMKTLKEKKPVVVSMGGMAASGAYYMSCIATHIIAHPTTLTGSIGIFGIFPDLSNLMTQKLGLRYDNVKTNEHSDFNMLQTARPFNAEEETMLQEYINRGYDLFCKRVAEGRKMPIEKVKDIAEGRVWLGEDAIKKGLIDQLGGINEAMQKAAQLASIRNYEIVAYPNTPDWLEQLTEAVGGDGHELDEQLRNTLGTFYEPFKIIHGIEKQSPIQARCPIFFVR